MTTDQTRRDVLGVLATSALAPLLPIAGIHAQSTEDLKVREAAVGANAAIGDRDKNKELLRAAFEAVEKGDAALYWALLADDVTFSITGTTSWSRTFVGKTEVRDKLLVPLRNQLDGANRCSAKRFIGAGNVVVVEARGLNRTKAGQAYENRYCWVFGMEAGRVHSIKEYADTQLVRKVLSPPPI
jgi:ketosteroid isomerase-like protein